MLRTSQPCKNRNSLFCWRSDDSCKTVIVVGRSNNLAFFFLLVIIVFSASCLFAAWRWTCSSFSLRGHLQSWITADELRVFNLVLSGLCWAQTYPIGITHKKDLWVPWGVLSSPTHTYHLRPRHRGRVVGLMVTVSGRDDHCEVLWDGAYLDFRTKMFFRSFICVFGQNS